MLLPRILTIRAVLAELNPPLADIAEDPMRLDLVDELGVRRLTVLFLPEVLTPGMFAAKDNRFESFEPISPR